MLLELLVAMGIVGTFSVTAGLVTLVIADLIMTEHEQEEYMVTVEEDDTDKQFIFMEDGTCVEYNEDDQE